MSDKKNNLRNDELQHSERGSGNTHSFEINTNIRNGGCESFNPNVEENVTKGNNPFSNDDW